MRWLWPHVLWVGEQGLSVILHFLVCVVNVVAPWLAVGLLIYMFLSVVLPPAVSKPLRHGFQQVLKLAWSLVTSIVKAGFSLLRSVFGIVIGTGHSQHD